MKKVLCFLLVGCILISNGCIERNVVTNVNNENKDYVEYSYYDMIDDLACKNNANGDCSIVSNVFQGLVKYNDAGKLVEGLAEKYEVSSDKLTYKFTIYENAKWSDGTKITADDFLSFFKEFFKDYKNDTFDFIFGVKEYRTTNKNFNGVAITSITNNVLQIKLQYPVDNLLKLLASPQCSLKDLSKPLNNWKENYSSIKYSGPYLIKYADGMGNITIEKNPAYLGVNKVLIPKIKFIKISSSEAALAKFNNDKIDIFMNPPINEINDLKNQNNIEIIPSGNLVGIAFNLKNEKFKQINYKDFREVISLGIDREEILSVPLRDKYLPAVKYINNSNNINKNKTYFNKSANIKDAEKALETMKLKEKLNLNVIYISSTENKLMVDKITSEINSIKKDTISVKANGYDKNEFDNLIKLGNYDIALINLGEINNSDIELLKIWRSNSVENVYGYKNIEFDNLLDKFKLEKNETKRYEYINKAEDILMSDLPFIPIYTVNELLCHKNHIEGVYLDKNNSIIFESAKKN